MFLVKDDRGHSDSNMLAINCWFEGKFNIMCRWICYEYRTPIFFLINTYVTYALRSYKAGCFISPTFVAFSVVGLLTQPLHNPCAREFLEASGVWIFTAWKICWIENLEPSYFSKIKEELPWFCLWPGVAGRSSSFYPSVSRAEGDH